MQVPAPLPSGTTMAVGWNKVREILQYLRSIRLVAGSGIRLQHTAAGIIVETVTAAGCSAAGSGETSVYNGHFAFRKSASGDWYICDGLTWDATAASSADSICMVNGQVFKVPVYHCPENSGDAADIYVLHFSAGSGDESATVAIEKKAYTDSFTPSGTDVYYFIGRIFGDTAEQEHSSGVAIIPFYTKVCAPDDVVEDDPDA